VVARCVRRAFLCGSDAYSGKNFDHRKQWLLDRIKAQAEVFAIDVCAYAVMSNHYHLVLYVDQNRASRWSDSEVIERWTRLFSGPLLIQRLKSGHPLSAAQRDTVADIVAVWRQRLADISWYMRCLNEFIARRANAEDNCSGRFWEGRFKSQALLDRAALIACMAYVDLNPVRAGIAKTLDTSDFTSVQQRLQASVRRGPQKEEEFKPLPLLDFADRAPATGSHLPLTWPVYLSLVAATGRQQAQGKRGTLSAEEDRALKTLGLSPPQWELLLQATQRAKLRVIGAPDRLQAFLDSTGRRRSQGSRLLRLAYGSVP
jgi:REP element-mobilizing transposase RayT